MSILQGLSAYYELFGVRGVAAICSYRVLGIPRELTIRPRDVRTPIHLRTRTTDVSVYNSVLLGNEYDVSLPFGPQTIVDAGANCGMATLYFANKYPEAKIIAVEPEPSNYAALLKNTRSYPNVVPVQAALWNCDCQLCLDQKASCDKDAFRMSTAGAGVRGITIRSLMRETGIEAIDLFKIDVEGAEFELFENPDWLVYVKAMAIEFHDRLRPGCRAMADAICSDFKSWQRGETTFYVRQ